MPVILPSLPPHIVAALGARLHGLSQSDAARRAATISQTYRAGGTSQRIVASEDALAYALARMPATYAAVAASLNAIIDRRPGFAPRTLLDCGAGPGTATFAAREVFDFKSVTMMDSNPALRALALNLIGEDNSVSYAQADVSRSLGDAVPADLVVASYVINEIALPQRAALTDALWRATTDTLLVIEPGTPDGYRRILDLRERLIAQGAHVIAPCPHDLTCPLARPDWCHFSQRLPRSRVHKALKGAELAFEDEKYIYAALSREPGQRPAARVLATPVVTKVAVTTKLCTPAGLVDQIAPRRDKAAYVAAKKRGWGDSVPLTHG